MSHIEVILEDLTSHPKCPHGPTILFSRICNGKRVNFFACSACRNRKECSFYLSESDNKAIDVTQKKWVEVSQSYANINHRKLYLTFNKIKQATPTSRHYCHTCNEFILLKYKDKHVDHSNTENISDYLLTHPSELLHPLDNPKKEAQFLFSKDTVKTLIGIIQQQGFRHVLCIGAPRIHEYISSDCEKMSSLLLDFDKRYHSFFSPLQFCWYNMFNNHFFADNGKAVFHDFLKMGGNKDLVVVMDPPFGGRIELLAQTVSAINELNRNLHCLTTDLPVLFIFPYFMEPQILNSFSNFQMMDYKVDYDNHSLFRYGPKGRKQGSPVRIFTNINVCSITLPAEEGYKYCDKCTRWVAIENRHCGICNACTSKDGRTYVHCGKCDRCVKPTWAHCSICNRCAQTNHECGEITFNQACFHCKEMGHKKRECPSVNHEELRQKRKMGLKTKACKKFKKLK